MSEQIQVQETILSNDELNALEPKGFDPHEYEGQDTEIEQIKFRDSPEGKGFKSTQFMIVQTKSVGVYQDKPVHASLLFSVHTENGKITGYPKSGKLNTFLKENNLAKMSDMVGLKVRTKVKMSGAQKDRPTLGFIVL